MGKSGPDFWTSLNPKDDAEEPLIYQARQGDLEAVADKPGLEFDLKHVLMHITQISDAGGEVKDVLRIVLITSEGDCLGTFSTGVRDSLATLFGSRGYPPYNPPVRFKVAVRKTNKGFKQVYLDRVFAPKSAPEQGGAPKKK